MSTRPIVGDARVAVVVGVALVLAGAWFLSDAYERRGRTRPLVMRALP